MALNWMCVKCGFKFNTPLMLGKREPRAVCPKCYDRSIREMRARNRPERRSCCGGR